MITGDMIINKQSLAAKAFFEAAGAKAAVDSLKHMSLYNPPQSCSSASRDHDLHKVLTHAEG